jgi:hypothetical protein
MPPSPHLKAHIKVEIAAALVIMGIAGGIGGWIGRSQVASLPPPSASTVIEGVASRTTRLNPFLPGRLRGSTAQTPSLVVPPPVLPRPLPPQSVGPLPPLSSAVPRFTDVPAEHWIYPRLADLAARELVAGFPDGSFRPSAAMTRAEFAAQLAQLFDLSNSVVGPQYTDVTSGHWAGSSIQRALEMRFLTGYPDHTFRPDQNITRLQAIVALANGLSLRSSRSTDAILKPYQDAQQIPTWAKAPVAAALEASLITAYPDSTKLAPHNLASRAEVVAMMHQALVYTGSLSPLPPRSVTSPAMPRVQPSVH